ncbi:hypothetical protein WN943_006529 [Citrus x changshan-huyou]
MPDRLSVTNPSVSTNVLGYGAFIGLHANMRYQLLCGFDRDVANHFEVIGVAMLLSTALRSLPPSFTSITSKSDFNFPSLNQLASFPSPDTYQ